MSFARGYGRFQDHGLEITAITVESITENRATIERLLLPFAVLADPDGEEVMQRYGVWDAKDRIPVPSIVVIGQDQLVRYVYRGKDFADRPGDDELLRSVEKSPEKE